MLIWGGRWCQYVFRIFQNPHIKTDGEKQTNKQTETDGAVGSIQNYSLCTRLKASAGQTHSHKPQNKIGCKPLSPKMHAVGVWAEEGRGKQQRASETWQRENLKAAHTYSLQIMASHLREKLTQQDPVPGQEPAVKINCWVKWLRGATVETKKVQIKERVIKHNQGISERWLPLLNHYLARAEEGIL